MSEIAKHASSNDYWVIMGDDIYSYENYIHPGGWGLHRSYAGGKKDMTSAFERKHGSRINGPLAYKLAARKVGKVGAEPQPEPQPKPEPEPDTYDLGYA